MGEGRARKRSHEALLRENPYCIYCGGLTPATTVEHMPPRIMFWRKHRPKGLEFPACADCNNGSSHADLVAAMLSRVYPDAQSPGHSDEAKRLIQAVSNNIPGLLQEMYVDEAGQKAHKRNLPHGFDGGLLRVGGPIMTAHMQAFALKLGLALHFSVTKYIIPSQGGVAARWFSNYEKFTGVFPDSIFDHLHPSQTLKQGKFEVSDQFEYSFRIAADQSFGMYFAAFRASFAVVAFCAVDRKVLEVGIDHLRVYSPQDVARMLAGDCAN